MAGDDEDASQKSVESVTIEDPYSHSIINEPSKLLICHVLSPDSQTFTVIFTVNLSGTSIGAGLRAVRRKATFRDLSTSIDSCGA